MYQNNTKQKPKQQVTLPWPQLSGRSSRWSVFLHKPSRPIHSHSPLLRSGHPLKRPRDTEMFSGNTGTYYRQLTNSWEHQQKLKKRSRENSDTPQKLNKRCGSKAPEITQKLEQTTIIFPNRNKVSFTVCHRQCFHDFHRQRWAESLHIIVDRFCRCIALHSGGCWPEVRDLKWVSCNYRWVTKKTKKTQH